MATPASINLSASAAAATTAAAAAAVAATAAATSAAAAAAAAGPGKKNQCMGSRACVGHFILTTAPLKRTG